MNLALFRLYFPSTSSLHSWSNSLKFEIISYISHMIYEIVFLPFNCVPICDLRFEILMICHLYKTFQWFRSQTLANWTVLLNDCIIENRKFIFWYLIFSSVRWWCWTSCYVECEWYSELRGNRGEILNSAEMFNESINQVSWRRFVDGPHTVTTQFSNKRVNFKRHWLWYSTFSCW